jgi:hypothetical protein
MLPELFGAGATVVVVVVVVVVGSLVTACERRSRTFGARARGAGVVVVEVVV